MCSVKFRNMERFIQIVISDYDDPLDVETLGQFVQYVMARVKSHVSLTTAERRELAIVIIDRALSQHVIGEVLKQVSRNMIHVYHSDSPRTRWWYSCLK